MKIITRGITPDGVHILLEDWREDYPGYENYTIGAYPIAKNTDGIWIRGGEKFRLSISRFTAEDDVMQIFDDLLNGKITLANLKDHFWNTYEDEYRLGLIDYAEYSKININKGGCYNG